MAAVDDSLQSFTGPVACGIGALINVASKAVGTVAQGCWMNVNIPVLSGRGDVLLVVDGERVGMAGRGCAVTVREIALYCLPAPTGIL